MEPPIRIDVAERIDSSRLGPFQLAIFILCGVCLFMD